MVFSFSNAYFNLMEVVYVYIYIYIYMGGRFNCEVFFMSFPSQTIQNKKIEMTGAKLRF